MLYNIFKYTQYGLKTHYENIEKLKKKKASQKGLTKKKRKEIKKLNDKRISDARLQALRKAHAVVIGYANSTVTEEQKQKSVHPRSKRDA